VAAGVAGSAALIAAITAASRLIGFGRVFVFSGAVGGGGCLGTAYTAANQVPNVLFEVAAGGALAGAVVPVIAGMLAQGRREDADRTASALLGWVLLVLAPVSLLLSLASRPLVTALLQGSAGTTGACAGGAAAGARMLVVFAPQVVLYGVGIVLTGVLQAHRRFAGPAVAPMLSSLVVIVAYLAYGQLAAGRQHQAGWLPPAGPELVLSGGTTLGVVALSLPLLLPVRRTGTRLRLALRFPPGAAARVRSLALAGLGALLAQQVAVVVTLTLASRVGGQGAINVVQFAQTVYLLPYAVLAVPLATAAFPRLSAQAASPDRTGFAATVAATTRGVLLVSCLGTGVLMAVAPAVQGLFWNLDAVGGGPLGSLADTLVAMAPGLVGWSLVAHLSRVLYARGRGRTAALATASGWAAAVVASIAAVAGLRSAGAGAGRAAVVGLGIGNSVGMAVAGVLLLVGVRVAAGRDAVAGLARAVGVGLPAAGAGAVAGRWAADLVTGGLQMADTTPRGRSGALAGWVVAGGVGGAVALLAFAAITLLVDRRDLLALVARVRRRGGGSAVDGAAAAVDGTPADGAAAVRPRVLLVLATSAGGVGRHVRALATGLVEDGCPVTVAGHPATENGFGFSRCGAAFVPVEVGDRPRPGPDLRAVRRLRGLLSGAHVVHAHGLRAAALVVLAAGGPFRHRRSGRCRSGPRVVVTLHNAPASGGTAGLVSALLERLVARGTDAVLVVSADLGERMRALGARRVERALVPAPHRDPSGPVAEVRARTRSALGVGDGTVLLLTVARLAAQKGLPVLFDAVAILAAGRPEDAVAAVVAGDGPLAGQLADDLAGRRPPVPVRLLGARDDVADLMTAADVLVMSSLWEGQPLAVQEALRAGLAVVATDIGGTAEVTGDATLLVGPGDAPALAAALARVVDDAGLRRELAAKALARAAALPSDDDAVRQVLAVYRTKPDITDGPGAGTGPGSGTRVVPGAEASAP
jgi:putative peptidoglycan lipid II flippase